MGKPPAFPLYAADFYMDTASWSVEEIGVYFRLLIYQWVNGHCPLDLESLARIAGVELDPPEYVWDKHRHKIANSSLNFRKLFAKVSLKFSEVDNGDGAKVLINERLEREREKQAGYLERQRIKGQKRAEKMWEGHIATAIATAKPQLQPKDSLSFSSSSSTSIQKKKRVKKEKPPQLSDEQFFDYLRTEPAYQGLDIDQQSGKCKAWCVANQRTFTRATFINWLNRAEKPIKSTGGLI